MSTAQPTLPACLTRDNLTSPYFPQLSFAGLLAIVALCVVFGLTSFNRLNHTDLWGHLNFGRWMAEHAALPARDPFAAAPAATPVLNAAWMSQLGGYLVQSRFGNEGLALSHALLVTLTAGVLMLAVYRRGAPALWAWSAGIAMFVLDLPIVGTVRPQLFGQLGAALFLLGCAELPRRNHPLFWLPIVGLLWANLHGSIVMGLAILGIFAAGTSRSVYRETGGDLARVLRDRRLMAAWSALGLVLAAACVNPHGPWLLVHTLLFNEHAALASISEWRALTPVSLTGALIIVSLGLIALVARLGGKKWEASEIALLLVFGLATLPAIRMLAWWAVVWPWVIVPHAAAAWRQYKSRSSNEPTGEQDEPTAMRALLGMGFVFATLVIAPPTYSLIAGQPRGDAVITVTDTPVYLADELVRRNLTGTLAAPMDWSDFLIWKTGGRVKPLVYSHVHLTQPATWKDYESLYRGEPNWLEILRRQQLQYVAVQNRRYPQLLRAILVESRAAKPRVQILYQDQKCVLAEVLLP